MSGGDGSVKRDGIASFALFARPLWRSVSGTSSRAAATPVWSRGYSST